ncbi:hypothetical protein OG943_09745 [Amycolatopsis sp. NBC_00345]|uniref:hypothetical protein n=1 Tax=Amycolatopsis sp. NBC_00345 TaxID=2975955 RepID=UPI002E272ADD
MLEAFVILGGIVIVLLVVGLIVGSKDVGRRGQPIAGGNGLGQAGRDKTDPRREAGYLFFSQPWS